MKKELFIHFGASIIFLALITLFHQAFSVLFIPLWVGGLIGTFLPDIDHLIYVYFLRPQELTSQRANHLLKQGQVVDSLSLLTSTKNERSNMIFHSIWFQLIFLALTFWVISSSGSLFGRGLVLTFSLHLFIDQIVDYRQTGSLVGWFNQISFNLVKEKHLFYLIIVGLFIFFLGFFL